MAEPANEPFNEVALPAAKPEKSKMGGKSLVFAIVLENPFLAEDSRREDYDEDAKNRAEKKAKGESGCCCCGSTEEPEEGFDGVMVDENLFQGHTNMVTGVEETFLKDDDLLLEDGVFSKKQTAPNPFMKVIEIVRRLETRGFDVLPEGMISPTDPSIHKYAANRLKGMSLNRHHLILSPDGDEMYIRIHATTTLMLDFAEFHGIRLRTNPKSSFGGMVVPYSKQMEADLTKSVAENMKLFAREKAAKEAREAAAAEGVTVGNRTAVAVEELSSEDDEDLTDGEGMSEAARVHKKKQKKIGFVFSVPDKMRIVERIVREGWEYGGCGIQVYEMRNKGILVKHFFPMHNKIYQEEYGIDLWGRLSAMVRCHPWKQSTSNVMTYFGEEIALYFMWLKEYTLFLPWIAVPGLVLGILPFVLPLRRSQLNGGFACLCVLWGIAWNARWQGLERVFSRRFSQDDFVKQETVRDEYRVEEELDMTHEDIYELKFDVPLTLQKRADGTLVDRYYSHTKRLMTRYLVSYPLIILLTACMLAVLILLTIWRFSETDNQGISFGSSILTVMTSVIFGIFFSKLVPALNYLENNRTDTDEEQQIVVKSFFFSFFSFYFALFIIVLWPTDISNIDRLKEISNQMLIICIVKPMIQNLQELLLPALMTQLRRRVDAFGGYCGAICSMFCCRSLPAETEGLTENEAAGLALWKEAQREPYTTTSDDYLEIAVQYGYMTMFAATFPWAPAAAMVYNTMEMRIDATKLLSFSQRPVAQPANSIGGWKTIFTFISACSVVTNAYLIAVLSPAAEHTGFASTDLTKFQAFIFLQYIFMALGAMLFMWGSSMPVYVLRMETKFRILSDNEAARQASKKAAAKKQLRELKRQAKLHQQQQAAQAQQEQ